MLATHEVSSSFETVSLCRHMRNMCQNVMICVPPIVSREYKSTRTGLYSRNKGGMLLDNAVSNKYQVTRKPPGRESPSPCKRTLDIATIVILILTSTSWRTNGTEVQNLPACAYGRTGKFLKIYVSGGNFWKFMYLGEIFENLCIWGKFLKNFFFFRGKKVSLEENIFPLGDIFWKYFCRMGKFFIFPADSATLEWNMFHSHSDWWQLFS